MAGLDGGISGVDGIVSATDAVLAKVDVGVSGVAAGWLGKWDGYDGAGGLCSGQERGCLAESGGRDALFAEGAEAEGVVAFGEADTGVVGHKRAMIEARWF